MIKRALSLIFLVPLSAFGYDTPQFYKARHFQGEPRFEKSGLITIDISSTGGKTSHAYNQCGKKIYLLDDLPSKLQHKLTSIDDFQKQRIQGEFSFFELAANSYIGLPKGIFMQFYAPFRSLRLDAHSPYYTPMISPLQKLLLPKKITHSGVADITTLIGLARNYQETEVLDFLDIEIKAGVIWPTSNAASQDIFLISLLAIMVILLSPFLALLRLVFLNGLLWVYTVKLLVFLAVAKMVLSKNVDRY